MVFPPWFANHQVGALGIKLPDVRGALPAGQTFSNTWASKKEWQLSSNVTAVRNDFTLPTEVTDAEKASELLDGSLNHRTLSARVRFVDFSHTYADKKRVRSGLPIQNTVTRTAKSVRSMFNAHAGGARYVWNAAINFIRRQPAAAQASWYKVAKL
jgi:hypothetical protein